VKCAVRLVPCEDSWRSAHHLSYVSLPRLPVGPCTCRLPVVSPRRARERLGATRMPLYRRAMQTSQANHLSGGSDALSDGYAQLDWATKRYDDMQRRFERLREAPPRRRAAVRHQIPRARQAGWPSCRELHRQGANAVRDEPARSRPGAQHARRARPRAGAPERSLQPRRSFPTWHHEGQECGQPREHRPAARERH
jgi:hypothetical protein